MIRISNESRTRCDSDIDAVPADRTYFGRHDVEKSDSIAGSGYADVQTGLICSRSMKTSTLSDFFIGSCGTGGRDMSQLRIDGQFSKPMQMVTVVISTDTPVATRQ